MVFLGLQFRATARGKRMAEMPIIWFTSVKCLLCKGFRDVYNGLLGGVTWVLYPLWRFLCLGLALGKAFGRGC